MALYTPSFPESARVSSFMGRINAAHGLSLTTYHELYKWSTQNIDQFWSAVWDDTGIVGHKGSHVVDREAQPPENPAWFIEAKVNYAENMLRCRSPDKTALVQAIEPEPNHPNPEFRRVSYAELYALVSDIVSAFLAHGLKPGDRIASYSSNCVENVAACLACAAIGCIWVSAAADFGAEGVFERLEQVQPRLIISVDAVVYNAKVHAHLPKLRTLLAKLSDRAQLRPEVVIIRHPFVASSRNDWDPSWIDWADLAAEGQAKKLGRTADGEIEWRRLDFNWPLGWMMWNFLVSGLSIGCTLVLYDGSPLHDPAYLWRLVDELGITIFGTSAKYIDQLALTDTGGTDICSLFAGMCSALPVFRGEIQCRLLGMAVEAFTPTGAAARADEPGELVCLKPFPCMPAGFWPLAGYGSAEAVEAASKRYQDAYFSEFKGVWCECSSRDAAVELTGGGFTSLRRRRPRGPHHYHAFASRERRWTDHARAERRRPVRDHPAIPICALSPPFSARLAPGVDRTRPSGIREGCASGQLRYTT
ncbi:Acetoacetyl-CoA synthetase [Trametes pubescens]|uniref:Acetoacetyl-CoA synthetase n=1 Tax=Trametes pubescens TaxID=154538 RepID=A0A1M2V863_TRAPU|nr:Acetoacetyl-CoA synthetase [Trametes pubescens]